MTKLKLTGPLLVLAGALSAFMITAVGETKSQFSPTHRADGQFENVRVIASIASVKPGTRIAYVYSAGTVQPDQTLGGTLRCPQKFPHPVSGGFDSNSSKTVLVTSRPDPIFSTPQRSRAWVVGVVNLGSSPANVMGVVVCEQ